MKKMILIVCLIALFVKPVNADLAVPTVEEAYLITRASNKKSVNMTEDVFLGFVVAGQITFAITNALKMNNIEIIECLDKPTQIWFDMVFDEYKNNRIKGNKEFYSSISNIIWDKCFRPHVIK